jgi:hypothetical protein
MVAAGDQDAQAGSIGSVGQGQAVPFGNGLTDRQT